MKIMLVMANYAKHYASTIYESLLTFCLSFLESILSDLEESLGFLHLGLRRGKRKPWSNSLIIEDLVVSYISQVEIAVLSYLQVSLREGGFVFGSLSFFFYPHVRNCILPDRLVLNNFSFLSTAFSSHSNVHLLRLELAFLFFALAYGSH